MKTKKIKFSIPFNGDMAIIKWAIGLKKVQEVYFSGTGRDDFSAPMENLNYYCDETILSLIEYCNRKGVETNLLLNKSVMLFEHVSQVIASIRKLMNLGCIDSVTIADPFIVPYIRKHFSNLKIQSSVYMGINSVQKAVQALKNGISVLNLEPSLNRDFTQLRAVMSLKKIFPNLVVKLLGNHVCYADCMYYMRHSQLADLEGIALKNNMNTFIFNQDIFRCHYQIKTKKEEIVRPFIRPEDTGYYEKNQLTDYIKIAFRNRQSSVLFKIIKAYFDRHYDGNLFELFDTNNTTKPKYINKKIPKDFIKKVMFCDKNCEFCKYCDDIADRCII